MSGALDDSYARCRELHRKNGRSYYLATKLLPRWKHRHVHALYGLTRYADDLVDLADRADDPARQLADLAARFRAGLRAGAQAVSDHPILPAVVHTVATFGLDPGDFEAFFASMTMDLTRTSYETYDDLLGYMEGSAAVIGTMMLPILAPLAYERAREPARQLGFAFQLTNFLRDVGEDLERGRVYLPRQDLERFGVTPDDLAAGLVTREIRQLLEFEMRRAQVHYDRASPGIALLPPRSRRCIRAARTLYREILDDIRRGGYDVFGRRARVPRQRKLAVTAVELLRPIAAHRWAGARG